MRLYSPLILLGMAMLVALAGCYPHRGNPRDVPPDQLLELAEEACQRRDSDANQMLLARLAERHPRSDEGRLARQLLDNPPDARPGCSDARSTATTRE